MISTGVRARRALIGGLAAVLTGTLLAGCEGAGPLGDAKQSDPPAPSAGSGTGTGPLGNPDGTKPGLGPVTSARDKAESRKLIGTVAVKGRGPRTGYERDAFGYAWMDTADGVPLARNGCDTRNDLLKRDGKDLAYRSGSDCVVTEMTLDDPYTGRTLDWRKQQATAVQIDHVIPLSYSWQLGSARWPEDRRKQLANDPLNLLPVDGPANNAKRDSGPASWLPPSKRIRCAYVTRFAQVAVKYELPVTGADKRVMLAQCGA